MDGIISPPGAKSSAVLSRPYDVDMRHHSTISSSMCRRIA